MKSKQIKVMAVTAILMAFNIVLSSFGVPVPGGHMYLNDVIICTAAILLNPFGAFMVGGVGAFIGDLMLRLIFVGLAMVGVPQDLQYLIKGGIILFACALDMRKYLVKK